MKNYLSLLFLTLALLTTGCSSDSDKSSDGTTTLKSTVSGTITDIAGAPLSGVTVHAADRTTTTDEAGHYLLELSTEGNVSVTADLLNHAQNSHLVEVEDNGDTQLDMTLVTIDALVTFDASTGESITFKGARVTLPADGYVSADGTPYHGLVTAKASYNRVTTLAGEQAFPGSFIGLQDDGSTTGIRSYGFIDVVLVDTDGNPLQLADGTTATLTFPMDPNIQERPATIPFWYYDTQKGIWVEDGSATYDALTDSYIGDVSHFTTWNLDAKFDGARFSGCLQDITGAPLTLADLYVVTSGWRKHVRNQDDAGSFTFINVPSNLEMTIYASLDGLSSQPYTFTLAPGEVKQLPACLKVDIDSSSILATVSGRLLYSDGSPLSSTSVTLYNDTTALTTVQTDSNGSFTTSEFLRPATAPFTLSFYANLGTSATLIEKNFQLHPVQHNTDIGLIVIEATHIIGCVEQSDGNTSFDNTGTTFSFDTPFGSSIRGNSIYNTNIFDLYILKDFGLHDIYAKLTRYSQLATAPSRVASISSNDTFLYGHSSFTADRDTLDISDQCILLDPQSTPPVTVTASITATDPAAALAVVYSSYTNYDDPYIYGENIVGGYICDINGCTLAPAVDSASFDMESNGIYYIMQTSGDCSTSSFDGSINITINHQDYNLTVDGTGYDAWAGFAIEFYQGDVNVITLDKAGGAGNCDM